MTLAGKTHRRANIEVEQRLGIFLDQSCAFSESDYLSTVLDPDIAPASTSCSSGVGLCPCPSFTTKPVSSLEQYSLSRWSSAIVRSRRGRYSVHRGVYLAYSEVAEFLISFSVGIAGRNGVYHAGGHDYDVADGRGSNSGHSYGHVLCTISAYWIC